MFPSHHFTVEDVVANGDKAAARWTMTAVNTAPIAGVAPTGCPITQQAIVFYRFEDGKIAEFWIQLDQVGVFLQIGVALPGVPIPGSQSPTASQPR
jgi:predicted ester cyclase